MHLVSPCSVHVKTNKHNTNSHQLTKLTNVTLLLPFSPSAIICPAISDKSLLLLCITRRHTRRHPQSLCHIQIHTAHMLALCLPPPSHAPTYQVDLLQALESAQVHAQRLDVVVLQLLQQAVLVS